MTQVDGESEDKEPLNALPSVGRGALNHELDGCEEKIVSYITHVLQPGETIRYQGSVRWILYLQALLLALVGAVASLLGPPWGWVASAICFVLAAILALRAWFIRWTNEIVVTDRRVIYAHGFIRPGRTLRAGRHVDNGFLFFHCLYHRCRSDDVGDGRLLSTAIKYKNTSVNWYGKPWDVVCDNPGDGIAQFVVCALPSALPVELPDERARRYSFFPRHVPLDNNYAHCEICTFREGEHLASPSLPPTVKKQFRQIMSDRPIVLFAPSV